MSSKPTPNPALRLEAGKDYKTRDGRVVKDLKWDPEFGVSRGILNFTHEAHEGGRIFWWFVNGRVSPSGSDNLYGEDLVEEVRQPRVFYMNEYKSKVEGSVVGTKTENIEEVKKWAATTDFLRTLKLVEVIE